MSLVFTGRLLCAAALAWSSVAVAAESVWRSPPQSRSVAVAEFVGLSPSEVRSRLADVPADWPVRADLEVATADGVLSFISPHRLLSGQDEADLEALFASRGDYKHLPAFLKCDEYVSRNGGDPVLDGYDSVLVFRAGRFESAYIEPPHPPAPVLPAATLMQREQSEAERSRREPVSSLFIARTGDLPLDDGAGFMGRWTRVKLAPTDRLGAG